MTLQESFSSPAAAAADPVYCLPSGEMSPTSTINPSAQDKTCQPSSAPKCFPKVDHQDGANEASVYDANILHRAHTQPDPSSTRHDSQVFTSSTPSEKTPEISSFEAATTCQAVELDSRPVNLATSAASQVQSRTGPPRTSFAPSSLIKDDLGSLKADDDFQHSSMATKSMDDESYLQADTHEVTNSIKPGAPGMLEMTDAVKSLLPTEALPLVSTPLLETEPVLINELSTGAGNTLQPDREQEGQAVLQSDIRSSLVAQVPVPAPSAPSWGRPLLEPPPPLTAEAIAALSIRGRTEAENDSLYHDTDTDSALGDMSYASSMTSVTSSIYESVTENGRTYHSYKPGKYMLPNDIKEQARLDTQHYMLCEAIGGRLFCAPLEPHRINRALDIATGTGIWAMEFADDFPNAEVIGTDLTPIQPRWCPPNCRFEVDDAEDEWVYAAPFSYIHGRALLSCFADPRDVIFKCVANLESGGWLEFQDATIPFEYDAPNTPPPFTPFEEKEPECAMQKWEKLTIEASIKGGRPWTNVQYYRKWFEEAGLVDVVERRTKIPIGTWEGLSKSERKMGKMHFPNIYHGIEGMTVRNFARLGWSYDQSKTLVEEVRREMLSRTYKPYQYTVVVMGRKA